MTRRRIRGVLAVLAASLAAASLAGCGGAPGTGAPEDPAAAVLELVAIARDLDTRGADADRLFGVAPDADDHAALFDTLAELGRASGARVAGVEAQEEIGRAVVDLEVALPGGGTARWSVRFSGVLDGVLQAEWLAGPGAEWPARRSRDGGLSSSATPE